MGYVESTKTFAPGHFSGVIEIDKRSPTTVLFETCIHNEIHELTATYTVIGPGWFEKTRTGKFTTVCGECQFLELPDGEGFLLVFQQYLFAKTVGGYSPFNSRTQIVGWWSDTASFTSKNTVGPFLLVDDRHCLPDQGNFRMWVGTPGVSAFREDGAISLYLYYVVERCEVGYHSATAGALGDLFLSTEYDAAVAAWTGATPANQVFPGIVCKKIDWSYFRDQFIQPEIAFATKTGDLLDTTDLGLWDTREAVEGELLGLLKFWFAADGVSGAGLGVRPFFDVFDIHRARFKAPHPAACDLDLSSLSLYTAATIADGTPLTYTPVAPGPSPDRGGGTPPLGSGFGGTLGGSLGGDWYGSGHGIWRGRALPHGRLLFDVGTGAPRLSVQGVDFVFSPIDKSSWRSADMVAASKTDSIYIDPEPVQLEDGTWWVLAGRQVPVSAAAPTLGELVAFAGTRADGCHTWAELYPSAGKAYARAARRAPPAVRVASSQAEAPPEPPHMTGDEIRASLGKAG